MNMGYLMLYTLSVIAIYYLAGSVISVKESLYLTKHSALLLAILVLYFGVIWHYKELFLGY